MKNRKSKKKVKSSKNRSVPSIIQHLEQALPVKNTTPSFDTPTSYCAKSIGGKEPYPSKDDDEEERLYNPSEYKFSFPVIAD